MLPGGLSDWQSGVGVFLNELTKKVPRLSWLGGQVWGDSHSGFLV